MIHNDHYTMINGRDAGKLGKISRCCFTTALVRYHSRYLRVIHTTSDGRQPGEMHLSIVKLSRFIRMMDRSPGRRNLVQFVTRANFVARGERERERKSNFSWGRRLVWRLKCSRKTHELHGDRIPRRLFTRNSYDSPVVPSPLSSPPKRSGGCLHSYDHGNYIVATRALFGQMEK